MTIGEALLSLSAYPIPADTVEAVAARRSLDTSAAITYATLLSEAYRLASADIFLWLSIAPDVSQGGQSYSFTDEERLHLRRRANSLYASSSDEDDSSSSIYGYKGWRL